MLETMGLQTNLQTRSVGRDSAVSTSSRLFPMSSNDAATVQDHYVTMHKDAYRRDVHNTDTIPNRTGRPAASQPKLSQRSALRNTSYMNEAARLFAERKAEEQAAMAAEVTSGQFAHREPMNRKKAMDFGREPVVPDPLAAPAITVYSTNPVLVKPKSVPHAPFGRDTDFSRPISEYKGSSKWKLSS